MDLEAVGSSPTSRPIVFSFLNFVFSQNNKSSQYFFGFFLDFNKTVSHQDWHSV